MVHVFVFVWNTHLALQLTSWPILDDLWKVSESYDLKLYVIALLASFCENWVYYFEWFPFWSTSSWIGSKGDNIWHYIILCLMLFQK